MTFVTPFLAKGDIVNNFINNPMDPCYVWNWDHRRFTAQFSPTFSSRTTLERRIIQKSTLYDSRL